VTEVGREVGRVDDASWAAVLAAAEARVAVVVAVAVAVAVHEGADRETEGSGGRETEEGGGSNRGGWANSAPVAAACIRECSGLVEVCTVDAVDGADAHAAESTS